MRAPAPFPDERNARPGTTATRLGAEQIPIRNAGRMALIASALLLTIAPASRADLGLLLNPGAFPSLGTLNLSTPGNYTIDTTGNPVLRDASNNILFTGTTYNQGGLAYSGGTFNPTVSVMAFDSITVAAGVTIRMEGSNPLALLSTGNASFAGVLDVSGQDGQNASGGSAGGAGGAGGGAGGSRGQPGVGPGGGIPKGGLPAWGLGGGYGGRGGDPSGISPPNYAPTYGDLNELLLGGSGGGGTFTNLFGAASGGGGGGALMLGACGTLALGGVVDATGGNGGGGTAIAAGGGSGGGLIFYAPTINLVSAVAINASGSTFAGGGRILFLTDTGTVNGGASVLAVNAGPTGNGQRGTIDYGILNKNQPPVVAPEPASLISAALGVLGLIGVRRWRRSVR